MSDSAKKKEREKERKKERESYAGGSKERAGDGQHVFAGAHVPHKRRLGSGRQQRRSAKGRLGGQIRLSPLNK